MSDEILPPLNDEEYQALKDVLAHTERTLKVLSDSPENEEIREHLRDMAAQFRAYVDGYEATH